jgi:GTP-binding protein
LPEIAFAGSSKVCKSSLINVLVNRKGLAKTSSTPGRTQLINFFNINDVVCFVDIPGYGYARVPAAVKNTWGPMIETYLATRKVLKGVVLIIDIRRTPAAEETNLVAWLNRYHIEVVYVLTKSDKLGRSRLSLKQKSIAAALGVSVADTILFSAKNRAGRDAVWAAIKNLTDI